jgi:thiosulfate/3-mercaptopyruvate sulfurtransferase
MQPDKSHAMIELPPLIEPAALQPLLGTPGLLPVDLSKASVNAQYRLPGAVFLDYGALLAHRPPVSGLVPDTAALARTLGGLGIGPETWVVAYDDEGGGKAARLLWTLDLLGHRRGSLLNGGLFSWANEGHPLGERPGAPQATEFVPRYDGSCTADADYIRARLDDPATVLVDARSAQEFSGAQRFSARGGHIPGARNLDWMEAMERSRNMRMRPAEQLLPALEALGVTPDKEVITYCQTHHRSSFTYWMLRVLGYPRVRGYPGSWSDWGNRSDTPVEP